MRCPRGLHCSTPSRPKSFWISAPLAHRSLACHQLASTLHRYRTLLPFSSKIRSRREFLYRSIKHSSAAARWLACRLCNVSSRCWMVASNCLIYSVRRSRNAAWACRFLCLRSSDVAYIYQLLVSSRVILAFSDHEPAFVHLYASGPGHFLA